VTLPLQNHDRRPVVDVAREVRRSAAILAGGEARRFGGRDKSALVVDGRTILERQIAELSAIAGLADLLIVGGVSAHPSARAIADRVPGSGPLGGIHAALEAAAPADGDALFVVACDMPYITRELVAELFENVRDADIVVPRTGRGLHPLCAVYTRACLEPIARRLAERRLKVMDLFADVRTRVVEPGRGVGRGNDLQRLLANVNTPEDFAALHGHNKP
jgi:molybdopterin-guanine dinucleotide biosynthesis protein A